MPVFIVVGKFELAFSGGFNIENVHATHTLTKHTILRPTVYILLDGIHRNLHTFSRQHDNRQFVASIFPIAPNPNGHFKTKIENY